MRLGVLFFIIIFNFGAHAYVCYNFPSGTQIQINQLDGNSAVGYNCEKRQGGPYPIVFALASEGGEFNAIEPVIKKIDEIIENNKTENLPQPTVVVKEYCM